MWYYLLDWMNNVYERKIKKQVKNMISPRMLVCYEEKKLLRNIINLLSEPYLLKVPTKNGNCYYIDTKARYPTCRVKRFLKNNLDENDLCVKECYQKYNAFNCPLILKSKL